MSSQTKYDDDKNNNNKNNVIKRHTLKEAREKMVASPEPTDTYFST